MNFINKLIYSFKMQITDDFKRRRSQMLILLFALSIISLLMSILNIITKQYPLLIATGTFTIVSLVAGIIGYLNKNDLKIASILFASEVFGLFSYFIICGGTAGFSTIWLLLLPGCGMLAFGAKHGSFFSGVMFLELIFFFYLPIGRSLLVCKEYTQTFLIRFPIVYLAFWLIGILLELIRKETYDQLVESKKNYEFVATHDELTKLLNRVTFNKEIEKAIKNNKNDFSAALLILDLDFFKNVNDKYGHLVGDEVLKKVGKTIMECIDPKDSKAYRWGGEEFAVFLKEKSASKYKEISEKIRLAIQNAVFEVDDTIHITVSIGAVISTNLKEFTISSIIKTADDMLYKAKASGRNNSQYFINEEK